MAIKSHNGRLGKFEYDDAQFSIADEENGSLIYIGEETNGTKIEIPRGVVDLTDTFTSSDIKSPPKIPYGVKVMKSTFMNTDIMEMPDIPSTVEILDYAFAMTKVHRIKKLPKSVKSMENIFMECKPVPEVIHIEPKVKKTKHSLLSPRKQIGSYLLSPQNSMVKCK